MRTKNRKVGEDTPEGTPVLLVEDDGSVTRTRTRSEPWKLRDGTLVVKVKGRPGGYLASRMTIDESRIRFDFKRPDFMAEVDDGELLVVGFPQWDSEEERQMSFETVANFGRHMFAAGLSEAQAAAQAVAEQTNDENMALFAMALGDGVAELHEECARFEAQESDFIDERLATANGGAS